MWPQTVEMIKWAREKLENAGDDALLLMTGKNSPMYKPTAGGNRGQYFNRRWNDLTERIQRDHPSFPTLSFNKLRKTGGNLMRHAKNGSGEITAVFHCRGEAVKTDNLIDSDGTCNASEGLLVIDLQEYGCY